MSKEERAARRAERLRRVKEARESKLASRDKKAAAATKQLNKLINFGDEFGQFYEQNGAEPPPTVPRDSQKQRERQAKDYSDATERKVAAKRRQFKSIRQSFLFMELMQSPVSLRKDRK